METSLVHAAALGKLVVAVVVINAFTWVASGCFVNTEIDAADQLRCNGTSDCPSGRSCVAQRCLTPEQLDTPEPAFVTGPAFADGEALRSDNAGKDEFHIAVELNQDADVTAASDVGDISCERAAAKAYTCTGRVVSDTAEGVHAVVIKAADGFGRTATQQVSLTVDKTAPTASLLSTTIARDGAPRDAAGDGAVVVVVLAVDEDVAEEDVSVAGAPPGSEPFAVTVTGRLVTATLDVSAAATAAGSRGIRVTTKDAVENTVSVDIDDVFTVDFDAPAAPTVDVAGRVVLTRAPWGKDGGAPFARLDGGAGAIEGGGSVVVTSDAAGLAVIDVVDAAGDGSFGKVLPIADLASAFVKAVDAAGNESDPVAVREGVFVVTTARPAGAPRNPVVVDEAPHFEGLLFDDSYVGKDAVGAGAPGDDAVLGARTQGDWRERVFPASPPPRERPAIASDAARGEVVLFGGAGGGGAPLADTWVFDGEVWRQKNPAQSPPARTDAAMAYVPRADRSVLFGGDAGGAPKDDLWLFDGASWTPVDAPAPRPPARTGARLASDGAGHAILFGGTGAGGEPLADTWILDVAARRWTEVVSATAVPARTRAALAFDGGAGDVVLFGGLGAGGAPLGDTFVLAGDFDDPASLDWTPVAGAVEPDAQADAALAFDAELGLVLFGVEGASSSAALFSFDGAHWVALVGAPPLARRGAGVAEGTSGIVVVGGRDLVNALVDDPALIRATPAGDVASVDLVSDEPPNLTSAGAAYDIPNARAIVSGGAGGANRSTWAFDGFAWTDVADDVRGVGVLARDVSQAVLQIDSLGGTERFNGGAWASIATSPAVGLGGSASAGFDGAHVVVAGATVAFLDGAGAWTAADDPGGRGDPGVSFAGENAAGHTTALLFGGAAGGCADNLCNDTWRFDAVTTGWTDVTPALSPPGREKLALAYDADRDEVILFGGNAGGGALADTWAFSAGTGEWRELSPAHHPPGRFDHALTAATAPRFAGGAAHVVTGDDVDGGSRVVLFGGVVGVANTHDLWEWRGGGGDRAALLLRVPFSAAGAGAAVVDAVDVHVVSAGASAEAPGSAVLVWSDGAMRALGENDDDGVDATAAATAAPVDAALDGALLAGALVGDDQVLSLAVVERGRAGAFRDADDVAVDYAEISFRYALP